MRRPFKDKRPFGPFVGQDPQFPDETRPLEPLAFVRSFDRRYKSGEEEGRISSRGVGTLSWDRTGNFVKVEYGFHESAINGTFEFKRALQGEGGSRRQGSDLKSLGGDASDVAQIMGKVYGDEFPFEFAELDAASLGHTHLTDYEFKYETSYTHTNLMQADIDEVM